MVITCASPGCQNAVTGNLACPTCKKFGMDNFFCSQDCFKKNWAEHKKVHVIAKKVQAAKLYVFGDFFDCRKFLFDSLVVHRCQLSLTRFLCSDIFLDFSAVHKEKQ